MEVVHLGAKRWERGGVMPKDNRDVPYGRIECGGDGAHWTADVDLFLSLPQAWLCRQCFDLVACRFRPPDFRIVQSDIGELSYEHPLFFAARPSRDASVLRLRGVA